MGRALSTVPFDTHSADRVAPLLTFDASVLVRGLHDHLLLQAQAISLFAPASGEL